MKITLILPCAVLLAVAQYAQCDNNPNRPTSNQPSAPGSPSTSLPNASPVWTASTSPTHPLKMAGVPNFGKLNENIWRSGQPTRAGYSLLASQGLKTVVNLRGEFPQDKDLIPQGVQYIYIPIKDEHAPTPEQAQQFINAASNPANWPLLVHCHAGEGRAGTMAALVRCTLDKWSDSAVMKETNAFISTKFLFKPQLASCQRQLIRTFESFSSVPTQTAGIATIGAPANSAEVATGAAVVDPQPTSNGAPANSSGVATGAARSH